MNHEDGINAGIREAGRGAGWYFMAAIPFVLGLGAAVWLGVYIDAHNFKHELSQEERQAAQEARAAIYVGSKDRPRSKLVIDVKSVDCTRVTKAEIDGSDVLIYAVNDCHEPLTYLEWHWMTISLNGTALEQGYTNQCPLPDPGYEAECHLSESRYDRVPKDDRAASIRIWTAKRW